MSAWLATTKSLLIPLSFRRRPSTEFNSPITSNQHKTSARLMFARWGFASGLGRAIVPLFSATSSRYKTVFETLGSGLRGGWHTSRRCPTVARRNSRSSILDTEICRSSTSKLPNVSCDECADELSSTGKILDKPRAWDAFTSGEEFPELISRLGCSPPVFSKGSFPANSWIVLPRAMISATALEPSCENATTRLNFSRVSLAISSVSTLENASTTVDLKFPTVDSASSKTLRTLATFCVSSWNGILADTNLAALLSSCTVSSKSSMMVCTLSKTFAVSLKVIFKSLMTVFMSRKMVTIPPICLIRSSPELSPSWFQGNKSGSLLVTFQAFSAIATAGTRNPQPHPRGSGRERSGVTSRFTPDSRRRARRNLHTVFNKTRQNYPNCQKVNMNGECILFYTLLFCVFPFLPIVRCCLRLAPRPSIKPFRISKLQPCPFGLFGPRSKIWTVSHKIWRWCIFSFVPLINVINNITVGSFFSRWMCLPCHLAWQCRPDTDEVPSFGRLFHTKIHPVCPWRTQNRCGLHQVTTGFHSPRSTECWLGRRGVHVKWPILAGAGKSRGARSRGHFEREMARRNS